jgi:hypothetical protein
VGVDQVDRVEVASEPDGVSFRVIDPNRTILAERNWALVDRASTLNAQNLRNAVFQVCHVTMDGKDYWGVARHQIGGRQALVEITLPADMQRAAWHAVTDELSLHVWVPLIPSALLFLLLAYWSVHSGLEPLHDVNERSNQVSKMLARARMDIAGLKREPIDLARLPRP